MEKFNNARVNALAKEAKGGAEAALELLYGFLKPYRQAAAKKMACLYDSVNFTFEDALSCSDVALMGAVRDWQEEKGASFASYYFRRALAAIQQGWEEASSIRVPHKVRQMLGKDPAAEDAAEGSRLKDGFRAQLVSSIDKKMDEDDGGSGTVADTVAGRDDPSREAIMSIDGFFIEDPAMDAAVRALPENQKKVLIKHFGFDGQGGKSNREISRDLGFKNEDSVSVLLKRGVRSVESFIAGANPLYARWNNEKTCHSEG